MCHYGNRACAHQSDDSHECRPGSAPIAATYHHPTLAELEQAAGSAEEAFHRTCREYLALRAVARDDQKSALDALDKWADAFRTLASARKALAREREALSMLARVLGRAEKVL